MPFKKEDQETTSFHSNIIKLKACNIEIQPISTKEPISDKNEQKSMQKIITNGKHRKESADTQSQGSQNGQDQSRFDIIQNESKDLSEENDIKKNGAYDIQSQNNFLATLNTLAQINSTKLNKSEAKTVAGSSSNLSCYSTINQSTIQHGGRRDSQYQSIPNSFKKEGVAFTTTSSKINIEAGLTGIYNMGNTCFINTAIQCLSAVQPLADFFIADLHKLQLNTTNPMGTQGKVTLKFAALIKKMWSRSGQKIYPAKLLNILNEYASHVQLVCGQQQDAQEFLVYLLDCLHEDLNRADKLSNLQEQKQQQADLQRKSLEEKEAEEEQSMITQDMTDEQQELIACDAWKEHLFNNRSIIVDLFQGQLKSTLKCLNCYHMSIKFDSFMYLSLPIPKGSDLNPTLEECVEEFTKEEILDGENKWKCPHCKTFQKATKKIDIWKMPSILIVHLKRFEFSEKKKRKITDLVEFPLNNLNFTPYVSKLQREKPIYDLFAVANHEGFLGSGHYYAYTKHRHNQLWYYFNDDTVEQVQNEDNIITSDAYILFYSKMTVDEFWRQTLSEPRFWPHIVNQKDTTFRTVSISNNPSKSHLMFKNDVENSYKHYGSKRTERSLARIRSTLNQIKLQSYPRFQSQEDVKIIPESQSSQVSEYSQMQSFQNDDQYLTSNYQPKFNRKQYANSKYDNSSKEQQNSTHYTTTSVLENIRKKMSAPIRVGEMIANSNNTPIVINNNNNNYFINLYMRNDGKY